MTKRMNTSEKYFMRNPLLPNESIAWWALFLFLFFQVMPNMKDFVIPTVNDYLGEIGIVKPAVSKLRLEGQHSSDVDVDEA